MDRNDHRRQLTGHADKRQVANDPNVGLIHNAGIGGMNVLGWYSLRVRRTG